MVYFAETTRMRRTVVLARTCPKCGVTRRAQETVPAWQCPACGIAYDKYADYLNKVKSISSPRSREDGRAPLVADGSVWSLIAANLITLTMALIMSWSLGELMAVYLIQSVVIGLSYLARMMSLDKFSTDGVEMNGEALLPTRQSQIQMSLFFVVHYGLFHFVYFSFVLGGMFGEVYFSWDLLVCALAFVVNHAYSYRYHRDLDRAGEPNIGSLMSMPYVRVVPMHLTIMFGGIFGGQALTLILFGILKTGADVVMHQNEHSRLAAARNAQVN